MTERKKKPVTRIEALAMARNIGCNTVHRHEGGWLPCRSAEELASVSDAVENPDVPFVMPKSDASDETKVSSSGRRRRKLVARKRWDKLVERSYGMASSPAGIVSAPPARPTNPMGGVVSDGSAPGITGDIGGGAVGGGKGLVPFTPEIGDPDTFTSPDAARMRAAQVGCTGIRRYTTSSGRHVWMPCTTGVTFDRMTGQGAYRNERSRTEQQRIERAVRNEIARTSAFSGSRKSARSRRMSRRSPGSVSIDPMVVKSLIVKAREHNAAMRSAGMPSWSFASVTALKSVMRRGVSSFDSSLRPDAGNRMLWGEMRVDSYIKMLSEGKPENPKYVSDNDLLHGDHPWRSISSTKRLPGIPGRSGGSIPLDGDGDGVVFDGTLREMPAPTRAVAELGRRAALMPLGGEHGHDHVHHDPTDVVANYKKMREDVESKFGEIRTQKQADKALRKVFKKLVDFDFDLEADGGDLSPGARGLVIGILHEGMTDKKYADAVLSLSVTGIKPNSSGGRGGYLGIAGMMTRDGKIGGQVDFNPKLIKGAAANVPPNPTPYDGWCDPLVREALKNGVPSDEIDEMFSAYIALHEWGHVLHFSKSLEDLGLKVGQDGVDKVGEMNGLSPKEISDELSRLEQALIEAKKKLGQGFKPGEARLLARQKFVVDNYQAVDDAWTGRPFDGLSDEEVQSIDDPSFRSQVSGYANRDSFEMVAETRSAEKMGHPIPEAHGWAKMSEWLSAKADDGKRVFSVDENGDFFAPICRGIRNPDRMGEKALPRDADRDGWIYEGEPMKRRFVGIAGEVADAARRGASKITGRKPKSRVRVTAEQGSSRRESRQIARGLSRRIEDTISQLREGEPEKNVFVPDLLQTPPERLSSSRLRSLLPSRKSHYRLVATQREFPHAPKPEGDHKPATIDELIKPDGTVKSTFDHFGIGSGQITPERQALHDAIIQSIIFGNGKWSPRRSDKPMAWMMGGGPASGKTFLRQGGFFDTPKRGDEAVHLDADEIKHMLPEFDSLVKELLDKGMDPTAAAEVVHAESTYIQKQAIKKAAEEGFHVVVDTTGDGGPKAFAERMKALKDKGYVIKSRIADVSFTKALVDADKRKKETGRGVPEDVIMDTHIDVARAILYSIQNGVFDDMEIVSNENHSAPYTIAAYKDGVLVVHDQKAWKDILTKALTPSTKSYEDGKYFPDKESLSAAQALRKRLSAMKTKRLGIDGVESVVSEPSKTLAAALPEGSDFSKTRALARAQMEELAKAYDGLGAVDEETKKAYEELSAEVDRLYDILTKDMGIKVEFVGDDPYPSHLEMIDDVETNKTLKVKRTTASEKHPLWTDQQSDRFRAVHDAFGHAATGRGFDRHGEEAAYQAHASMTTNELARRALATETRAQNAAMITTGTVPPRKAGLIPETAGTKADPAAKLPTVPQMAVQSDVPQMETSETPVPMVADDDNLFPVSMCHHVSGGRVVEPNDVVVPTKHLYSDLPEDTRLSPETRQMIYRAAVSGQEIEDSDVDETNKQVADYYARMVEGVKSLGKQTVAEIPVSAVESLPYPLDVG